MHTRHSSDPFHRIAFWTGTHYVDAWLRDVGLCIYLGHDGEPCPNNLQAELDHDNTLSECDSENIPELALDDVARETKLPTHDCLGNHIMTFVHSNGIHGLGVRFCQCPENDSDHRHLDLLNSGFYPATQTNPSTVFTLSGLDYALIDNLECKTVPNAYSKKLRRLTDEHDPGTVPNRYIEFLRIIRQYRHLKTLITFGFGHQALEHWQKLGVADLAWRCVACPSGTNLPRNWQESENAWKYYNSIAMDGNFSAQHLASRVPENNVNFTDGLGYFSKSDDYSKYLKSSKDDPQPKVGRIR
ncbi:hypothetical protein BC826DRAFT_924529 [Russula brevipes]|nr:hypothetical protein BC826DRAFT_924529 [Russula brevipes]